MQNPNRKPNPGYGPSPHGGYGQPAPHQAPPGPDRPVAPWAGAASDPNAFVTRVFGWMTMGVGLTAVIAWFVSNSEPLKHLIFGNPLVFWGLIIAEFGLVLGLSAAIRKLPVGAAIGGFLLYSALNGATLAAIFLAYTLGSIASTFAVTTATFGFMFVYGWTTKKDLTSWGSLLIMGLWGIIIASIVNIFFASSALYWITTYAGVLIFVGLTAYDAQKIKQMNAYGDVNSDAQQKNAVLGALMLYLDFINLFIMLLRILGDRR